MASSSSDQEPLTLLANVSLDTEMGMDQVTQNVNPLANNLSSSSSASMANSSSDKGSSEYVKALENSSNEDPLLSFANLCLNNEMGTDQNTQKVSPSVKTQQFNDNNNNNDEKHWVSSGNLFLSYKKTNRISGLNRTSSAIQDSGSDFLPGEDSIVALATTRKGLTFLFHALDTRPDSRNEILQGITTNVFDLITDEYGHRLLLKLLLSCNTDQLNQIMTKLASPKHLLIYASLYPFGAKSVMRLIEVFQTTPFIQVLIDVLAEGIFTLMTHMQGNEVILKCLVLLDSQKNKKIYEALSQHCIELTKNEEGCQYLCKCIDVIKDPYRDLLPNVIFDHSELLSTYRSGIFVLMHVLDMGNQFFVDRICSRLQGTYIRLSLQKEGSLLAEYCLILSRGIRYVIHDLVNERDDKLLEVACDPAGNYVIQTALMNSLYVDIELHWSLLEALEPCVQRLKLHPIGKMVYIAMNCGSLVNTKFLNRSVRLMPVDGEFIL